MKMSLSSPSSQTEKDSFQTLYFGHDNFANQKRGSRIENDQFELLHESSQYFKSEGLGNSSPTDYKDTQHSSNWLSGFLKPRNNNYDPLSTSIIEKPNDILNAKVKSDLQIVLCAEDCDKDNSTIESQKLNLECHNLTKSENCDVVYSKWYHKNNLSKAFARKLSTHASSSPTCKIEKINKKVISNCKESNGCLEEHTSLITYNE